MPILLHNSLSRQKEALPPPPGPVGMYVCGPTVYQRIHVGNARPFIVSMWLKRWLEHQDYRVKLVENVTDINDKIYEAAAPQGIPSDELARRRSGTSRTPTISVSAGPMWSRSRPSTCRRSSR